MCTEQILKSLNLLFIDDDSQIKVNAYSLFSSIFNAVTLASDYKSAEQYYLESNIDIIITDIEMGEDKNGLDFIQKVREVEPDLPIIVLSAYSDKNYLLRAANLRIDGYIVKPLSFKKINPILDTIAQRLQHKIQTVNLTNSIRYSFGIKRLTIDDQIISLGNKERNLLELFLLKSPNTVSKQEIDDAIWENEYMTDSSFKSLLNELRQKLVYPIIENRRGLGWYIQTLQSP